MGQCRIAAGAKGVKPMTEEGAGQTAATIAAKARQLADWAACAMFAAVFLIFNYKIFTRYFEHDEAVWADEILVILFIWIIFWANAFLVRDKEQITFDLVYSLIPPPAQRVVALLRVILIGGIFAWALPGSLGYIRFLWREHTPVLNLPLNLVYSCFGLFLIAVIARSACSAVRLLGPKWRSQI
jgi:TRAP-type C4-dicarboxylate transport system permease small subunit